MIGGKRFSGTFLKGNDKLMINYFFYFRTCNFTLSLKMFFTSF